MLSGASEGGGQPTHERCRTGDLESFAIKHRLKTKLSEDGTKIIPGKFGHIYEHDADMFGVLIMPSPPLKRYWGCARKTLLKLGFTLVQNGDGEGAATFEPGNSIQERTAIRVTRIKRKRQLSPSQQDQRAAYLRTRSGTGLSGQERGVSLGRWERLARGDRPFLEP